jgi:hypothetical protein
MKTKLDWGHLYARERGTLVLIIFSLFGDYRNFNNK